MTEASELAKLRYEVFGPFKFRMRTDISHRQALREFWKEREVDSPTGLKDAVGVYVWTFREGKRRVPHNVGLTDRQGFAKRFVQKESMFLRNPKVEEWEVYLLALRSKSGRFRRLTSSKTLDPNDWLETMLIVSALEVNNDLVNKAKVKYLKSAVVDGYRNDDLENRSPAARSFSRLFKAQSGKRK